ncbi:MAG TPA: carboxypeptidase regulatory-like domain-containing protein [Terracidiphilus sp.]|nr:carboxypeptidase regulatory-like domain-containing protein [Terracidiphilus sp.]
MRMQYSTYPRRSRMLLSIAIAALLLIVLPFRIQAQTDTGSIAGTILDPTGAVIPGAAVTAINTDNGLRLTAVSNSEGQFTILAVPRGNYAVQASANGFQTSSLKMAVTVTTTQSVTFQLRPAGASSTVQVTDVAPLVNTSDATIGATIEGKQVTDLPLNGRNFSNLALLTPGVTRGAYGDQASGGGSSNMTETIRNNESGSAAISVNGLRPQADNYILDGVDNNDGMVGTILIFPNIDATQEFKVDTNIAPAEYGRAGGAIVISSIKCGTNAYHGSVFEFYRDRSFDSNPNYRFNGAPATPAGGFLRNQPGFSIGGPILRNKLFGFGDYQALRETLAVSPHYLTVPTALMRTGNFSELQQASMESNSGINIANGYKTNFPQCYPGTYVDAGGKTHPYAGASTFGAFAGDIFDVTTCQPFQNNIIPTGRLNPAAVNYLNAFPLPTRTDRFLNNYLDTQTEANKYNTFDARFDWNASASDTAFIRFSYDNSVNTKTSEFKNLPAGGGTGMNPTHARSWAGGYTHIFSPAVVNEARIAYNRDNYGYTPPMYGDYVSKNLGIVNANINQETTGGALIGGWSGELEYTGDYGLYAVPQNTYELTDAMSWNKGSHSFKFGGTFIRRQVAFFNPQEGKGYFWIDQGTPLFTGYEVSELLAGGVMNYQIGSQSGYFANVGQEDGIFGQDDWRVNRRLTLNLGLRWDFLSRPYEMHDQQAAFNVQTGQVMIAGKNGISRSIVNQDYHNFGPRLGFAYNLDGTGKTVLRGGYGIFYFIDYGSVGNQLGEQPPFGGSNSYLASNGYCITFTGQTATQSGSYNCSGYTDPSKVVTPLPARGYPNFNPAAPPKGTSMIAVNRDNPTSMVQEWNLQLERQLGASNVVNLAYVGTHGSNLSSYYPYNLYQFGTGKQDFPGLGSINYNNYNGISNYDGLQAHFEHRQSNGLVGTFSYAWSHTLDDSTGAYEGQTAALYYDPMADYGNSTQDQRQVFSSSILYPLPFGRGQHFAGNVPLPLDWLIGGWQTSIIALVQTGTPFDLSTGQNQPGNRPDRVGSINYPKSITGHWFDPAAFSANIPTTTAPDGTTVYSRLGNLHRNQVYGPGYRVVNLSLQKNLHVTERYTLELHGDAFNLLNSAEFTNPNSNVTGSNFGQVEGTQVYSNREIQLAARFTF